MKIIIDYNTFKNALKNLKLIKGEGLYISAIDKIELISNNLSKYIEMSIEISGTIISQGKIFIPDETLKMVEQFKDGQLIITDKSIICGSKEIEYFSEHDIKLLDYKFDNLTFTLSPKELTRLLEVSYATTNDLARPYLAGICIRKNRFLALNGVIGSIRESNEFYYDGEAIISQETWQILKKLKFIKDIEIYISDENIRFKSDDIKLDSKKYDGSFMNLEGLFRDGDKIIEINIDELMESIKIMEKMKYNDKLLVKFKILNDELNIECEGTTNTFKDTLKIKSNIKEEFQINFDIKYLKPVISQYKDNIEIEFTTIIGNPLVIKKDGQGDLVLPVVVRG